MKNIAFPLLLALMCGSTGLLSQSGHTLSGPERQRAFLFNLWGQHSLSAVEHQRILASLDRLGKKYFSSREKTQWMVNMPSEVRVNKAFYPNHKASLISGRIRDIAVDVPKTDSLDTGIRVLTASGGLYGISEAQVDGSSMVSVFNLSKSLQTSFNASLAVNPNRKGYILIGSGEPFITCGQGLFLTQDNGASWQQIAMDPASPYPCLIHKMFFDPVLPFVVHAATSNGYMRSLDEGLTWERISDNVDMTGIARDKNAVTTLYCIAGNGQLYVSNNLGEKWNTVISNLPLNNSVHAAISIDPVYSNIIYVNLVGTNNLTLGLYKSVDGGTTFTPCTFEGKMMPDMHWGQGYFNNVVETSPLNNNVVFAAGGSYLRSENTLDYKGIDSHHADHHAIVFDSKGRMYIGSDGGLFISDDNGLTFSGKYNIFPSIQFYHGGLSRNNPNYFAGGTQDNGTVFRNEMGWYTLLNGDGTSGSVNHDKPNWMYGTDNGGKIRYSLDAGNTWKSDFDVCLNKYITLEHEKSNAVSTPNPLLAFCENSVFRKTASGWTNLTPTPMLANITYMTVSNKSSTASRPNIYLTVSHADPTYRIAIRRRDSDVWSISDNTNYFPLGSTVRIFPHPYKFDVAYAISLGIPSNGLGNKVYKTENAGLSWINISGNLPNVPLSCIAVHPKNDKILMVGTSGFGFLESIDEGITWYQANEGAAAATIVAGIDVVDSSQINGNVYVMAYTHGHSLIQRKWKNETVSNTETSTSNLQQKLEIIKTAISGNFQLHFLHDKQENVMINIISLNGQILHSVPAQIYQGTTDINLDLSEFSKGLYLIQILYEDQTTISKKVICE